MRRPGERLFGYRLALCYGVEVVSSRLADMSLKIHLVCLSAIILLYCFLVKDSIARGPYPYDEADYMYAAAMGLAANYADSPTLQITDFVRTGLKQSSKADERMDLSQSIRDSNDIVFYRHWHGPLFFYPLLILNSLHLDEHTVRCVMLIVPVLTAVVLYLGSLWLFPGIVGAAVAWLTSTLFLWSYITVSATELAPHQLFVLCSVAALLLLAKMAVTGERRYWFGAVAASALAFCALEIAFVLILTLVICCFLERRRLKAAFQFLARSLLLFLVSVLIVWPGAILKLSFLKAYAFMAYLAVYRKGAWGTVGFAETWWIRFTNSPVEWILIAAAFVLFFRNRNSNIRGAAYPFLIFGLTMVLATFRVASETPRYALPFQPALEVFAALVLANALTARIRITAIAIVCTALFFNTFFNIHRYPPDADARNLAVLACIREHHFEDKSLLVPQAYLPMLHYYFPKTHLRGYLESAPPVNAFQDKQFDGVLFPGDPVRCAPAR
jgi:hypothetical protein